MKSISHRSRFVAKGYSQVHGLHYFENYAPVASFITIRLLFALTSIPDFKVLQYDVSVAFIQSKLDPNHPPVYCECAEGYEDRSKYVYRLHRHLYGMKDSPRGWGQLFASVCADFDLTRLKSDESVFVRQRDQRIRISSPKTTGSLQRLSHSSIFKHSSIRQCARKLQGRSRHI